jgi:LAGLIDADG DNA endonuclease family protein
MHISLDYIAGFFDADGCISLAVKPRMKDGVRRHTYQPRAIISQSNYEILEGVQLTLGLGTIREMPAGNGLQKRVHFNLTMDSKAAIMFARTFQDRCHLKGPQLKSVVEFYDAYIGKWARGCPRSEFDTRRALMQEAAERVRANLITLRHAPGPEVWANG